MIPVNVGGLGSIELFQACQYPQIVDMFDQIPVPAGCSGMAGGCNRGLGIFDSGMDWSQWGIVEWSIVAGGAYFAISLFSDASYAASSASRAIRRRRKPRRVPATAGG